MDVESSSMSAKGQQSQEDTKGGPDIEHPTNAEAPALNATASEAQPGSGRRLANIEVRDFSAVLTSVLHAKKFRKGRISIYCTLDSGWAPLDAKPRRDVS